MQLRAAFFVTASLLIAFAFASGCGRSALDGYDLANPSDSGVKDSGSDTSRPDGSSCDEATCPNGCCDSTGTCQPGGTSLDACGSNGGACVDCLSEGFDTCDPDTHSCARLIANCDQATCPNGCCLTTPDGLFCEDGTSANACGNDANTCTDCQASGAGNTCDPNTQQCVAQTCDPSTCSGCCTASGECHVGTDQRTCGNFGDLCEDCTASAGSCVSGDAGIGGSCVPTPPTCTPATCAGGCCVGPDTCVMPDSDTACGIGGGQCENCKGEGKVCQAHACAVIPCAATCATSNGCCSPDGVCHAGFLSTACGQGGNACSDCTSSAETCDVTTRSCNNTTSTCPSTYGSCAAGITTPTPITSTACSTDELANAASACTDSPAAGGTGGPHGPGCTTFLAFEKANNSSCGTCLAQFDYTFLEAQGLYTCVEPFVSSTCNHNTGCAADCTTQSCDTCSTANEANCESQVRTGQCVGFFGQSLCALAGFGGGGAVCNPTGYTNRDYGLWLQGVGAHYCAD
ncbi:MAG: hypothetical protein ABI461_13670 [Polyangiaceae bacterium]